MVRSDLNTEEITAAVRREVSAIDPTLPVTFEWLTDKAQRLTSQPKFNAVLLTSFAATGVILAGIGLYGMMAFAMSQRTQEIGVRMAIGATRWTIIGHVFVAAAVSTTGGAVAGLLGSLLLTRSLRALLFQVRHRLAGFGSHITDTARRCLAWRRSPRNAGIAHRCVPGIAARLTASCYAGGSRWRVVVTPVRIPSPIMQTIPTPIQRGGTWRRCAPMPSPTIRTMSPIMYMPNDI